MLTFQLHNGEPFNPFAESLVAYELTIRGAEGGPATADIVIDNPGKGLLTLSGRRIYIARDGAVVFEGELIGLPIGILGPYITLSAVARPADEANKLTALAASLRIAPYYDPLTVPPELRGDIEELLAGHERVLAYDRVTGAITAPIVDGGAVALSVVPYGPLDFSAVGTIPSAIIFEVEASWVESRRALIDLSDKIASPFYTITPDSIAQSWPRAGSSVGAGWTVERSAVAAYPARSDGGNLVILERIAPPVIAEDAFPVAVDVSEDGRTIRVIESLREVRGDAEEDDAELDPHLLDPLSEETPEDKIERVPLYVVHASALLAQRVDIRRQESIRATYALDVQPVLRSEPETVAIRLEDLQPHRDSRPVSASYRSLPVAVANKYGTPTSEFVLSMSERGWKSFSDSDRGRALLAHLAARAGAMVRKRARVVHLSFSCDASAVINGTDDMLLTVAAPHLPGAAATGRVVAYELRFADGAADASVTIACSVGTNGGSDVSSLIVSNTAPAARLQQPEIAVSGRYAEQKASWVSGAQMSAIPQLTIKIDAEEISEQNFEQSVVIIGSGPISTPRQIDAEAL